MAMNKPQEVMKENLVFVSLGDLSNRSRRSGLGSRLALGLTANRWKVSEAKGIELGSFA